MTDNIQKLYEIADTKKKYLDFICKNKNCEHKKLSGKFACVNCFNSTRQEIKTKCLANIETIEMQSDGEDYQILTEFESGERCERLEQEVERQRTTAREYEQRWLTSMGYYGVK